MPKPPRFSSCLVILICSILLLPGFALSQITNVTDDQSTPTAGAPHDYIKMLNETVNPANGSVSIRINVPVPKSRGITLPFSFSYDSNGVDHLVPTNTKGTPIVWAANSTFLSQGGWSYSLPLVNQILETRYWPDPPYPDQPCNFFDDYTYQDSNGGRHSFYLADPSSSQQACVNLLIAPITSATEDYYTATLSPPAGYAPQITLKDADATTFNFTFAKAHSVSTSGSTVYSALPDTVVDRNGNTVNFNDTGNGAFTMQDTVGRNAIVSNGFGSTGNTISVSGLSNPYSITWETIPLTGTYDAGAQLLQGNGNCWTSFPKLTGSVTVIKSILLPDLVHSYQFLYYSDTGLLKQITYPNGGFVQYTWNNQLNWESASTSDTNGVADQCAYEYGILAVTDRYVSFDGNPNDEVLHQHFVYQMTPGGAGWTDKTTTVTTTDNNRTTTSTTTFDYSPYPVGLPPYETNVFASLVPLERTITYKDWDINPNGPALLKTVNKMWRDQYKIGCEQTTLGTSNSGSTSLFYYNGSGAWLAQMTEKDEYDSGTACPATLPSSPPSSGPLRRTLITYATISGNPAIADRPATVITADSGDNTVAETDYGYDGNGNATSKTQLCLNTCSSSPETIYTYDTNGQQTSMKDPNGNFTQYGYDSYGNLDQITYPNTGVAHILNFVYDPYSGLLTSSEDENQQTTTYGYSDLLNRPSSISYPDGGLTSYTYGSTVCGQPSKTTILLGGSSTYTETATLDGFCHVTQTANSDPAGSACALVPISGGADCVDKTYDGMGLLWKVSNRYRSTSETTYGLTKYTYDALGRTINVTYPDNSSTQTTYSGNSSTVKDPAIKTRTLVSDALGRLTSVTEDPSVLNYQTTYRYNALNDLTCVLQGGTPDPYNCASTGGQVRAFGYDSLARVTSAANPESGTTYFTLDGDGNILTRKDARNITTTYAYDGLNRVLSKTYTDGTPTAVFGYDETSVSLGSCANTALSYTRGRLTHTYTLNSQGTALTATVQDYDPMGRITGYWQATPLNCGTSMWPTFYGYDLAGDVTGWIHPAGFIINQTVNTAREITQVTSSLNDATHPGTLATATYTAFGSVSTVQNGCAGTGCTPLQETYQYNKRLQAAMIELGSPTNPSADSCRVYNFYDPSITGGTSNPTSCVMPAQGTDNNGNVAGYYYQDTMNSGLGHSASYHYDTVNRLTGAAATGSVAYSQSYAYDPYGNLNCGPSGPGCVAFTYTAATNHISGYTYDPAGNVTNDGTNTYQWDAESHLTAVINGQSVTISANTYNALGQRVRDVTQTTTTDEAYGAGGSLLWRYTGNSSDPNQRAFVPFGGGILAEYFSGGTLFDHADELGSISAASDQTGNNFQERLYYPFGESWTGVNLYNLGTHQTFAQLPDYDPETDQYNTANRHYSPSGRWMSPDPGGMKVVRLDDPQTWNMYAYVRNNPTTLEDPSGLEPPPLPGYFPPDDTDLEGDFLSFRGGVCAFGEDVSAGGTTQTAAQNGGTTQSATQNTTSQMSLSSQGLNFIKQHEGYSATIYKDSAGNPTIGYGHLIIDGEDFSKGITEQKATELLSHDTKTAVDAVNAKVTTTLSQTKFDAMVDFTYNEGGGSLGKSTLLSNINSGKDVTKENFTDWNHAGGKVNQGLTTRRTDEYNLFSTGAYGGP